MELSRPRSPPLETRFLPGVVLADRYRIIGLLGKGGMGEVYRADDLKLGQPVALKFLPPGLDSNPERLGRFLGEVRAARQVSHPNVCRIYDAAEADGHHFLSMEYIDGEDLASLLRRIGHLPKDKAIQIARQLCAGLAASHEIGLLHRDLKPANIMIDGRGRARITDFGLARFVEEVKGVEILSGTPAYMAPEQLTGREVSVRSDLYSLGLVLYELCTGQKAFKAASADERRRRPSETTPSPPSSLMEDFDPTVERVILRCLEADPARRPSSALAVAAALPGGDPLSAALAAGETPSPEMVAEAGDGTALSPAASWTALALFSAALGVFVALSPRTSLLGVAALEKPPEVLQERAREILVQTGYDRRPADSLFAFEANRDYLEDVLRRAGSGAFRWDVLRATPPSGILFWYRQSTTPLSPLNGAVIGSWLQDPPDSTPGMARVGLDADGRLVSLLVVRGERNSRGHLAPEPDWGSLLRATGVDTTSLVPVPPEWAPPVFADRRAAWTGSWPGKPDLPLRIEAASAEGKPVSLRIILPWTRAAEAPEPEPGLWHRAAQLMNMCLPGVVIVVAGFVALRNVRRGRGDRRGALRLALYLGAARFLWFLGAHHVASTAEFELFIAHLAYATLYVGLVYAFYLAIEPYARRLWPRMLVSWVRILDGGFRDPLVGRDLLVGAAAGAWVALVGRLQFCIPEVLGGTSALLSFSRWTFEPLRGALPAFVSVVAIHTEALLEIIFPMTWLLILRLLLRSTAAAAVATVLLGSILFYPETGSIPGYIVGMTFAGVLFLGVLFRSGLLAFAAMFQVYRLLDELPLTLHPDGWFLGPVLLALAFIAGPALWGFWTSRAGRPLFRDEILEPAARP
jgi:eukaryotic-like serine/threonine-protein kinase